MITTTGSRSQLSRAASHCQRALKHAVLARGLAKKAQALTPDAEYALTVAREETAAALSVLEAQGVRPEGMAEPKPIALHLLDTPDSRELLDLLQRAQLVAERVDAARGRALPEGTPLSPGESRGTDLSEAISLLALRVRTEVHGPAGRE